MYDPNNPGPLTLMDHLEAERQKATELARIKAMSGRSSADKTGQIVNGSIGVVKGGASLVSGNPMGLLDIIGGTGDIIQGAN